MTNQFIKITKEEAEANEPKRGKFSRSDAYINLKLLLYSCKPSTKMVQGELVALKKWEKELALTFLSTRWKWNDAARVSRQLKKWQSSGFISIRKGKRSNFNILGLPDSTIDSTIVNTTVNTIVNTTVKPTDNQPLRYGEKRLNTIADTTVKTRPRQPIQEGTSCKKEKISSSSTAAENLLFKLPYQKQIDLLVNFFKSDAGTNTLKIACDNLKRISPPSTKDLVREVDKWAAAKYRTQSHVLLSYDDGWKCWLDFSRFWLRNVSADWKEATAQPKKAYNGQRFGKKGAVKRIFKDSDYHEGQDANAALFAKMKANTIKTN